MKYFFSLIALCCFLNAAAQSFSDTVVLFQHGQLLANDSNLIPAKVPGSVYSDLYRSRKIADPFFGDNEKKLDWVEEQSWTYIDTFELLARESASKDIQLILEGIDTYSTVILNDSIVTSTNSMFVSKSIDVKKYLRNRNILKVIIHPTVEYARLHSDTSLKYPGGDRVYTRRAAMNYGWDFAPDLRAGAIWKPVYLVCKNSSVEELDHGVHHSEIRIDDVYFIQKEISKTSAKASVVIKLGGKDKTKAEIVLKSVSANVNKKLTRFLTGDSTEIEIEFSVDHPKLWSTNGKGKADLYDLEISVASEDGIVSRKKINVGFRDLKLVREKDKIGESFYFLLNEEKIFCKGANVVPPEYFEGNATNKSWKTLVDKAVAMNMNMLRIWGGGVYPPESFYDECDKNGILVWQDFMFACSMYPGDSSFIELVKEEARQAVKQFRNHPSLALWCGNNENIEGWYNWGWQKEFNYSKEDSLKLINDYDLLFNKVLSEIIKENDPQTDYWPSSPSVGWGRKESMLSGDSHYWGVWWGMEPFEKYKEKVPRFMSEYGFQSLPAVSTVSQFAGSLQGTFNTPSLKNHQKHPTGFETISRYQNNYYLPSKDMKSNIYLSNILQAKAMKTAICAHRGNMDKCSGSLLWQLNDCWPGISWSLFDYYGKEKSAYYEVKKCFQNVIVTSDLKDKILEVKIVSDSINSFKADLIISVCDFDGNVRWSDKIDVDVKAGNSFLSYKKDMRHFYSLIDTSATLIQTELSYEGKIISQDIQYFTVEKYLKLKRPSVSMKRTELPGNVSRFEISLNYFAKNVELSIKGETGNFSDNFFDMLPYVKYYVDHYSADPVTPGDGLNIRSLVDMY